MEKDYSRYWQLSKFYLHEDITLQLNKMKNKKNGHKMQQRLPPSYSSLQIIGWHSFISIQSLSTNGDRKWSASVFHKKGKTYWCQMTLRGNASPKRRDLVTPNQHKFLVWRNSQKLLSCGKEWRTKITDTSPAVVQDSIKISNWKVNCHALNPIF